jgi:UDP-sugar transporter A1/2/3
MAKQHASVSILDDRLPIKPSTQVAARLKVLSLVSLTVQNALSSIIVRYSRVRLADKYATSTVICVSEILKLICSAFLVCKETASFREGMSEMINVLSHITDTLKVAVPSFIYVVQNNLLFVAASNLDVGTYQVSYQLKILTTAFFFIVMLRREITPIQWVSLTVLSIGVALVQLAQVDQSSERTNADEDRIIGFVAILAACCLSGFAGVYFEKILKSSKTSIWMRNVQLSLISCPLALITCFASEGAYIQEHGFFHGYDFVVWVVVALNSLGGLIVAVVIKYADNILKGFSTSIAIVIGCLANVFLFNVSVNMQFVLGACLVVAAVLLYGYKPSNKK